jgi:hypothetical protein
MAMASDTNLTLPIVMQRAKTIQYATRDDDGIRLKCPKFRRVLQYTNWVPYVILVEERCSMKTPPHLAHLMRSPSIRTHSGGFNS